MHFKHQHRVIHNATPTWPNREKYGSTLEKIWCLLVSKRQLDKYNNQKAKKVIYYTLAKG